MSPKERQELRDRTKAAEKLARESEAAISAAEAAAREEKDKAEMLRASKEALEDRMEAQDHLISNLRDQIRSEGARITDIRLRAEREFSTEQERASAVLIQTRETYDHQIKEYEKQLAKIKEEDRELKPLRERLRKRTEDLQAANNEIHRLQAELKNKDSMNTQLSNDLYHEMNKNKPIKVAAQPVAEEAAASPAP